MKIPSNNIWTQTNEGDISGILHSTRNVTLDTPGKIRLSEKTITIHNTASNLSAGFGLAIVYFNDQYVIVGTDGIKDFDLFGADTTSTGIDPTPSVYGDGIIFNNLLHVTTNNNLSSWDGSIWTNSLESNTSNVPHPMEIFDSLTTFKLAIGNGNTVKLIDASYNNATAVLTLPSQYIVTTLAYRNGYMYVGTRNIYGGQAAIFIWDGNGNNANYEVNVSGNWVYSIKPYRNSVCAILSSGELIYVNGTVADRLGALPVFFMPSVDWQGTTDDDTPRVFHRGMITDGDLIYLNVNAIVETGLSGEYLPGFESGIWVFDPANGLYHRASTNYMDKYVIDDGLSVTDSVITTSNDHYLKTGDSVVFQSIGGLDGTNTGTKFYVSVQSPNSIKLALTRRALQDGDFLEITGTADSDDKLVYSPNREYFQYARVTSGAIAIPTTNAERFRNWSTPIIWSAGSQDFNITTQRQSINILADSYNVGFFETQRIYSDNIEQSWKKLYTFLDGLNLDNEEVIVKYRTGEENGYPTNAFLAVWEAPNKLNLEKVDNAYVKEGDEVMIVDGYGRGYSAHVISLEESSAILSLTLDESVGTNNQSCRVSFTNYQKTTPESLETKIKSYLTSTIDKQSPWIQVKVEMRGFETAVNMLDLSNAVQKNKA